MCAVCPVYDPVSCAAGLLLVAVRELLKKAKVKGVLLSESRTPKIEARKPGGVLEVRRGHVAPSTPARSSGGTL